MSKCRCGMCGEEGNSEDMNELFLDGTKDVYSLSVCNDCYDLYGNDYFEPYQVDNMF